MHGKLCVTAQRHETDCCYCASSDDGRKHTCNQSRAKSVGSTTTLFRGHCTPYDVLMHMHMTKYDLPRVGREGRRKEPSGSKRSFQAVGVRGTGLLRGNAAVQLKTRRNRCPIFNPPPVLKKTFDNQSSRHTSYVGLIVRSSGARVGIPTIVHFLISLLHVRSATAARQRRWRKALSTFRYIRVKPILRTSQRRKSCFTVEAVRHLL